MDYSNSEALAVMKWMVRARLMETMCEAEPGAAFDGKIREDFAELMEAGIISFAEVTHRAEGGVSVTLHRDDSRFVFGAAVVGGRIEIERRAMCF